MIQNLSFNLFGDYKEFEATPDRISRLLTEMSKKGLSVLPGTFQQVNPGLGMKKFERMEFTDSQNNFLVSFNVDAIHMNMSIRNDKSYNLTKNIREFTYNIKKVLNSLSNLEEKLPNGKRVSLIVSVLHDVEKIKSLEEIYKEFSNSLPAYNADETFEWSTRVVKREQNKVLDYDEKFNIVSEVMRTQGEINNFGELSDFDTINTLMDINTLAENQVERINSEFVNEFLISAVDIFSSHYELIEVKLNNE